MSHHGPDPLDPELRRAGAFLVSEHGSILPASFGSVVGEIALMQEGVGMADREDLTVLEVSGARQSVAGAVERIASMAPEAGYCWFAAEAWWCVIAETRVLAIAEPGGAEHLSQALRAMRPGMGVPDVNDVTDDFSVISLIGPRAASVLVAAGIDESDLPALASFNESAVAATATLLVRETKERFLLLARRSNAVAAWTALRDAGLAHGIGFVGHDALARHGVAERRRPRSAARAFVSRREA